MKWTKKEKDFVDTARVARLATVDANGNAYNVPICPLLDGDKIYFATEAEAKKVRNIKINPRVTLVFDEYTEAWDRLCGIMIRGKARLVDAREFRRLRRRFYAKYLRYESAAPLEVGDSAIVEVTPENKFGWGL